MSTTETTRRKFPAPTGDAPEPIKIDIESPADPSSPEGDGRQSPASSNGDNAVREKLKKTNLEPGSRPTSAAADHKSDEEMNSPERTPEKPKEEMDLSSPERKDDGAPRRTRKRSHDESEENDTSGEEGANKKSRHSHRRHERKRSREVTAADRTTARLGGVRTPPTHTEEEEMTEGIEAKIERAKSPSGGNERKRALGTAERELGPEDREPKMSKTEEKKKEKVKVRKETVADTKSEEAETKEATVPSKILGGGWGNTSSKSPFATAGTTAKPLFGSGASTPSSTASTASAPTGFAQSKFRQLASSSASPFGALKTAPGASPFAKLGSTGTSPFGSPKLGPAKPTGGVSTASGAIGFGGSTLKSTNVFGGGLKSSTPFGAPASGTSAFGSGGKIKTASAAKDDDEGEDGEDGPDEDALEPTVDPAIAEQYKKEQEVTTGEEDELTRFKAPMKIYFFDRDAKAWKERGRCTVKLNTSIPDKADENDSYGLAPAPPALESSSQDKDEETSTITTTEKRKMQARFILRADGTHAVVLNTRIYDGMKFGELNGNEPSGNTAQFLTADGGMWLFKAKSSVVKDLWHELKTVKQELGYN
ncbi:hypothetical protein EX30DRAFT_347892 [Ascodesmis nigricans]|uniref:RanBD1 domain-containing protein n=1 Tax=Ascodesmis nigricans TaxID=341454 RepID=A0A4S2N0Q0_9PEZI|nr:hypothetical protein EX30DRAFT_347892 [Ascodesmis nigricans]